MTFELLRDYSEVAPIFVEQGGKTPPPQSSVIVIARDEAGKVAGLVTLQTVLHAGPAWVRPDCRGKRLIYELFDRLDEVCKERLAGGVYYNFPTNPVIERMLAHRGHVKVSASVWKSKEF